jgi:hypothetical protein
MKAEKINNKIKVSFPSMATGQDSWALFGLVSQYRDVPDNRSWYKRLIYRVLMWTHDRAESVWHWCYYTSLKYQAPKPVRIEDKCIPIDLSDYETTE